LFQRLTSVIDHISIRIGRAICWLALAMVLLQFTLVAMRYVFGVGSVMMQELIIYMHATLFMAGAGYTLQQDDHVRCDIFYRDATPARRAWIDLLGVFFFLWPMCVVIFWVSVPYVVNAWAVLEGSSEGSLGLPGVFLLKTLIPTMAVLLGLQGLSVASRAVASLTNRTPAGGPP